MATSKKPQSKKKPAAKKPAAKKKPAPKGKSTPKAKTTKKAEDKTFISSEDFFASMTENVHDVLESIPETVTIDTKKPVSALKRFFNSLIGK